MSEPTSASDIRELTRLELLSARVGMFFHRVRRKLPYLVWLDDELDVRITIKDLGAIGNPGIDRVFAIETALREIGVHFDKGSSLFGRDWEWDYSLEGPISVAFRSLAERSERRTARPIPRLATNNGKQVNHDPQT